MPIDRTMKDIGLLLYPGAQLAAVHGLTDLFHVANRIALEQLGAKQPPIRVRHWRLADDLKRMECDFDTHPGHDENATILLAPPCLNQRPAPVQIAPLIDWLREQYQQGAIIGSVCAGAFILAHSGLLDGRRATTHWALAHELANGFPKVRVEADKLLIDEGDIITAGGLTAWIDLGLSIVNRLLGATIASHTARFLVADPGRHSQQHFITFKPNFSHGDEVILKVQRWLSNQSLGGITSAQMATCAALGERTFLRRFSAATGYKPNEYLQRMRIEKARELLELTQRPIESVAGEVGYQDAGTFRQMFKKFTGLIPREYRKKFALHESPPASRT
ncbi:GlxA family transcriptional regulator [Pseudomonas entomophila]|uniref:GlxA family transcriptional regulator n=1 Tax=Pseudomonas entomophila TaxID=312306 RepID=UPI0023D7BA76|nr:GlxA family transcriptional regulator [Pseudomonas entomophila]MDF0731384.1 GlxA family transcriptional regulator [Pseudomonas entomophila]